MKRTTILLAAIAVTILPSCGILNPVSETVFGQPLIPDKRTSAQGPLGAARPTNAYDVMIKEIEADMLKGRAQ